MAPSVGKGTKRRLLEELRVAGVSGTWLTWIETSSSASVVEVTEPDSAHPTAGWYVESNLSHLSDIGGNPGVQVGQVRVDAACVTVPSELEIIRGSTSSNSGFTTHVEIGWELGARACALTRISGRFATTRFAQPGWDDGAMIEPPTEAEGFAGPWRIKVNDGRSAGWACVGDPD
ncbi:hypothetical protein WMF04_44525 [Sorangium sp. So ce260]|uniref:hypothetical protein n=1 Tax=Sorangium sp. So ce260 TaxID=3133291 RepID=UPI003F641C24